MAKEISNFNLSSTKHDFCEKTIFHSINQLKGINSIIINAPTHKVVVEYDPDKTSNNDIIVTMERQGYSVT
jgi:copper chaperone CopZ